MFFAARIVLCSALICALGALAETPKNRCSEFNTRGTTTASYQFKEFLKTHWNYEMTESPEYATYAGFAGQDHRLSDVSLNAMARRQKESACILAALNKIPRQNLVGEEKLTYDLLRRKFELGIEGQKFGDDYMPISQMGGPHSELPQLLLSMPTAKVSDYENMLSRLEAFPIMLSQYTEVMREGIKRKYMPVKFFMSKISAQMDKMLPAETEQSPYFGPFKEMNSVAKEEQVRIRARAKEIIDTKIRPAMKSFRKFFEEEYVPQAREDISIQSMPNGVGWYAYEVKRFTTTDKTPDELHQLGVSEVERIGQEMAKIREQVKFSGDAKSFSKFLLKDKRFQYTNEEDLLAGYRDIAKRIDAELPKQFKTLPRTPYGVRAMPATTAPAGPAAYYEAGSLEFGRAGFFTANTFDLPGRPKWVMASLTMHEAVPGHHLQISIAQELKDLPLQRRHAFFTAYTEGWGLYAEGLGDKMGIYKDPYSKYGNLYYEMLRAVRLVVDTGMHAKGWSKQKALDYYRNAMPAPDVDSENEIDRYISWPAQALAYKVGQLKFRELRDYSQRELGEAFDIREYHDEVLRHGALPMDVLQKTVEEWVAAQKQKGRKKLKS